MVIPNSEATLQHYSRPNRCSSLLLAPLLDVRISEVIQSTPLHQAYDTNNDISPMLYFSFYKPVYYLVDETTFPSKSNELRRRWVGVSKNVGHLMTYKILTDEGG
jgi:hypothetical protein